MTVLKFKYDRIYTVHHFHVMWVPVTTEWRVIGLRMEESVAGNILYIQPRTAERSGPPAWGLGEETTYYEMLHKVSELALSFENGNETSDSIKGEEFRD
jgi:hypothetical protein